MFRFWDFVFSFQIPDLIGEEKFEAFVEIGEVIIGDELYCFQLPVLEGRVKRIKFEDFARFEIGFLVCGFQNYASYFPFHVRNNHEGTFFHFHTFWDFISEGFSF